MEEGVEGLVHISEVDSAIPKAKLPEFYPVGTQVHARVIKVDLEERRLGLSILRVVEVESPLADSEQSDETTPEAEEAVAEAQPEAPDAEVTPEAEEVPEAKAVETAPEAEAEKPKKKKAAPKRTTKAKKADDEQPVEPSEE